MIARAPVSSWQTILADLSLILFMVTASALANAPDAPLGPDAPQPPLPQKPVTPSPRTEPVGVWTDGPGAPPLDRWLATEARDPRLRLTIAVRYARTSRTDALAQAARLGEAAGPRAASARMVVEPGASDGASVALGYDREAAGTQIAGSGA